MTNTRVALVGLACVAAVAVGVAVVARPAPVNAWTARAGNFADGPAGWLATHDRFRERTARADVVFLGDSYTEGWPAAPWVRHFAPLNAVNSGIRGDGTAEVLWRVTRGELDGRTPRAVVLLVGLNNAHLHGDSADDAARGLAAVLAAVRSKVPDAKVLLLGVLPVLDPGDPIRGWLAEYNARAAPLADGVTVRYRDFGPLFLEADGRRKPGLYAADGIHLSDAGYDILAAALAPALSEMP